MGYNKVLLFFFGLVAFTAISDAYPGNGDAKEVVNALTDDQLARLLENLKPEALLAIARALRPELVGQFVDNINVDELGQLLQGLSVDDIHAALLQLDDATLAQINKDLPKAKQIDIFGDIDISTKTGAEIRKLVEQLPRNKLAILAEAAPPAVTGKITDALPAPFIGQVVNKLPQDEFAAALKGPVAKGVKDLPNGDLTNINPSPIADAAKNLPNAFL